MKEILERNKKTETGLTRGERNEINGKGIQGKEGNELKE
jgi:hypothetical protein